jgi:cob(I)alamin adenosyltransferase
MVRLDRIYTGGGDEGMTSLGDGTRVRKTHPRVVAYGSVDELNSILGVATLQPGLSTRERALLRGIQNDLFDLGADLCVPRTQSEPPGARLRTTAEQSAKLERAIDSYTDELQPLASFILPGGRPAAAWLHVARVVCRRAELDVVRLWEDEVPVPGDQTIVYLNRLSDLLFVMARWANGRGRRDVLWQPGGVATDSKRTPRKKSSPARPLPRARRR